MAVFIAMSVTWDLILKGEAKMSFFASPFRWSFFGMGLLRCIGGEAILMFEDYIKLFNISICSRCTHTTWQQQPLSKKMCRRLTSEMGKLNDDGKCLKMRSKMPQHMKSQLDFPAYSASDLHGKPIGVSNKKDASLKTRCWDILLPFSVHISILHLHYSHCLLRSSLSLWAYSWWHQTTNEYFMTLFYPWANNRCYKKLKYISPHLGALHIPQP